jgi:hypothetical protein
MKKTWIDKEGNSITIKDGQVTLSGPYWHDIGVECGLYPCQEDKLKLLVHVNKRDGKPLEFMVVGVDEDELRVQGESGKLFKPG